MGPEVKALLHFAILCQCLLLFVYVARSQREMAAGKLLFLAFLILKAIPELGDFIYYFQELRVLLADKTPHVFYVQEAFEFAWVPIIYLYFRSKLPTFKFTSGSWLHFLPFGCMALFGMWKVHSLGAEGLVDTICYRFLWEDSEFFVFSALQYLQFFGYAGLIFRSNISVALRSERLLKNGSSDVLLFGTLLMWKGLLAVDLALWIFSDAGVVSLMVMHIAAELIFLIGLSWFVLFGLENPKGFIFHQSNASKYRHNALPKKSLDQIMLGARRILVAKELFRKPDLRLQDIAQELDVPMHDVSRAVNEVEGMNFQEFINKLRIEESMSALIKFSRQERTISEIQYEVGFNSKSAFNTSFRKFTGTTPKEYRQTHQTALKSA